MATEQMLPPEMPLPPEGVMPVEQGIAPEEVLEAPVDEGLIQSQALADDESANNTAIKIITDAKKSIYGQRFDDYMEVLQGSDNIVEDIALLSIDAIVPSVNAVDGSGIAVPYDQLMDVSAEVVSEVYDMAVQTGIYNPTSEEEVERNQNISLTMVAGELGKSFGAGGNLPTDSVEGFIDNVMDGHYDDYNGQQSPDCTH